MSKANYILIPLVVVVVALLGNWFTGGGMEWYETLSLPSFTPPGYAIGIVWTAIFILGAVSALLFWNKAGRAKYFYGVASLFILNAVLNALWSYLFFVRHLLGLAVVEMGLLNLTTLLLMVLIKKRSKAAAWLLLPYFLWVSFATYLAYQVWMLN